MSTEFINSYFKEVSEVASNLDKETINKLVERLVKLRSEKGRLFLLGVGGSAGNCGHAVNDFRKLAGIEAYAPTDNVSELTARTNDEGWDTVFSGWLKVSQANSNDAILIFSVGGGNREKNISPNLVSAIDEAKSRNMTVLGIVGRDGGYTKQKGDIVVIVPTVNPGNVTPHSEAFQAVIWHGIVSDPRLMMISNKWESTVK
ncbi:MAG: SIS domain-containing protein [Elusimicrobiota bacterium]